MTTMTASFLAQAQPPRSGTGISPWTVFLAFGAILGVIGVTQQLLSWIAGRRRQRALQRFADDLGDVFDRRDTEQELLRLRQLERTIRDQIENQLPQQAERIYLEHRMRAISMSIGELFGEYKAIEEKLGAGAPQSRLESSLRAAVEATIMPSHRQQERSQRQVRLLLLVVLLLLVSPLSLASIAHEYIERYTHVMYGADDWTPLSLVSLVLQASLVVAMVLIALVLITRRQTRLTPVLAWLRRTRGFLFSSISAAVLGGSALYLGLVFRNWTNIAYSRWEQCKCDSSVSHRLWNRFLQLEDRTGWMLMAATALLAIAIAITALIGGERARHIPAERFRRLFNRRKRAAVE